MRAQDLFQHGAISQAMLEQAEDTEKDAKADLTAAEEQLKTLGVDKDHPSSIVNVYAPISGVIVAQNVTDAAAAGVGLSGSATAFTIADLSRVWVVCDVYENDIPKLQLGQEAKIKLNAYPDRPLTGRISDIGPILDPSLRTAKVRIEVANPGFLKLGMFGTATFTSRNKETHAVVPADAVLHLHDRDWVYLPAGGNKFKRVEVHAGRMLDGNRQEILSGLQPGQQVVDNALLLEDGGEPIDAARTRRFRAEKPLAGSGRRGGAHRLGHRLLPQPAHRGLPRRRQQLRTDHYPVAGPQRRRD